MRTFAGSTLIGLGLGAWLLAACNAAAPVPAAPDAKAAPAAAVAPAAKPGAQPATGEAPAAGKGRIQVAEKSVELGDLKQGDKATHTFILKNVGTDVLHIRRAKGS
jgi:hypothetical protein